MAQHHVPYGHGHITYSAPPLPPIPPQQGIDRPSTIYHMHHAVAGAYGPYGNTPMFGQRGRPAAPTRGSVVNTRPDSGRVALGGACAHTAQ
eukprot:scaffold2006_cov141-Isochrysis_galbana.AAC.10